MLRETLTPAPLSARRRAALSAARHAPMTAGFDEL